MKNYIKLRLFILLVLSVTIMSMAIPLSASNTISDANHKETIQQYISDIRRIQDQIFYLSQIILRGSPEDTPAISNGINLANHRIQELHKAISSYLEITPTISAQNRDALFASISLSLSKNALYQLNVLVNTHNYVDKSLLLEDFYLFKKVSTETLEELEELISRN